MPENLDLSHSLIENDSTSQESALFAVDADARRIRGLVLPYGELSRQSISGAEPVMFARGTVSLPADPAVIPLTDGHPVPGAMLPDVRGRAVEIEDTDAGIVATFEVARTPEGDGLLKRAQATPRPRLSAEIREFVRDGVNAVSARLRGVALVSEGAFASTALFALAPDAEEDERAVTPADLEDEADDTELPQTADADADTPAEETTEEKEDTMSDLIVPEGVETAPEVADNTSEAGLFAALARKDRSALEAYETRDDSGLFALASVQHSGPSAVTIGADVQVPNYIGELWSGRAYNDRYRGLFNHANLTGYEIRGWRWVTKPQVAAYAGNNAEVASNAIDTEPVVETAERYAGAHRIDRRFVDFNDQGFLQSYTKAMVESAAKFSDEKALAYAVAGATVTAPGTVPTNIPKGLAAIVDGALDVIANDGTPTFAVVNSALYRDIILSNDDNQVLQYLSAGFGLEAGSLAGFKIVPSSLVAAGKVLVGDRSSMTFYELGGAPIRVEGLVPANGAIEPAVYGYTGKVVHNAKTLRIVTVAA